MIAAVSDTNNIALDRASNGDQKPRGRITDGCGEATLIVVTIYRASPEKRASAVGKTIMGRVRGPINTSPATSLTYFRPDQTDETGNGCDRHAGLGILFGAWYLT